MDKQRGVSNHSPQSYPTGGPEQGRKPAGNWLTRKLSTWKVRTTDFLRHHGILPDTSIYRRKVDESESVSLSHRSVMEEKDKPATGETSKDTVPVTPARDDTKVPLFTRDHPTIPSGRKRAHQYLLKYPCQFALRCIDEEKPIPPNFVKDALTPGLRAQWKKAAGIPSDQAERMIDLLVSSFGIQGMDIDDQFLESYESNEDSKRFTPLSPEQKFNLIIDFSDQLKGPETRQTFEKILNTMEYYQKTLEARDLPMEAQQGLMENLAEYLIKNAGELPALTNKGLAACSHFSKFIESLQYEVKDIPGEMKRFIDYVQDNPETFAAMDPDAIATSYIFHADFEDLQKPLLPLPMEPYRPDKG